MKKIYNAPVMEVLDCRVTEMLAASTSGIGSEIGIGYGGVDVDGKEEAASRIFELLGE